ncbi:putative triosephosphate isomerase [Cryptosporidium serpentis]|uniref:Triosephosphate isomerase n=1 Tax=Cryptosporidium canis TaxID=195482 RepID=A0A9D5DGF1_9CRYT|nr:triosephosphate isomerase [Cryptosporidium canis]
MARQPFVGGNFKCNGTKDSLRSLLKSFKNSQITTNTQIYVFPTFIHIPLACEILENSEIKIGSQDISSTGNGAYTGEISCDILKDYNIHCTLIGHSERRQYYCETDLVVNTKVLHALEHHFTVVLCIGESLQERESGKTNDIIKHQLKFALKKVSDLSNIIIAYEPIWAIGTGVVATPEQAQETHKFIRKCLLNMYNHNISSNTRIIYGGSVNPENCNELINCADIDGFLVGGASLKPSFVEIINCTSH